MCSSDLVEQRQIVRHPDVAGIRQLDHPGLAQHGDLAADGLDGQAQIVGDRLAGQRQLEAEPVARGLVLQRRGAPTPSTSD